MSIRIVISPTKKQRIKIVDNNLSLPFFLSESVDISKKMKTLDVGELKNLFKSSDAIAMDNFIRFSNWTEKPDHSTGTQALYTFVGEVFNNINPDTLSEDKIEYLNSRFIIFSGLYGVLKPKDLIMPYRLDIADSLKIEDKSLYTFWKDRINDFLKEFVDKDDILLNLASVEYTKNIDFNSLNIRVITPHFRTRKSGKLKNIPVWSKKMRGLMVRLLAENSVDTIDDLLKIELPDYKLEITEKGEFFYIKEE